MAPLCMWPTDLLVLIIKITLMMMTMVTMIFTSAEERGGPSSLLVSDGETKAQLVISEKLPFHRTGHVHNHGHDHNHGHGQGHVHGHGLGHGHGHMVLVLDTFC